MVEMNNHQLHPLKNKDRKKREKNRVKVKIESDKLDQYNIKNGMVH